MIDKDVMRLVPPTDLSVARAIAHQGVQLLTRTARANLAPVPDDSHSNLGWDAGLGGFLSQPIAKDNIKVQVGLTFNPLKFVLVKNQEIAAEKNLQGLSYQEALAWIDSQLESMCLKPSAAVELPYELPDDVAAITEFDAAPHLGALAALAGWFGLAHQVFSAFAVRYSDIRPGPSPVRCWPHHFDIATYVALESGDAETAKGIGVGLSPGDESYDQPYLYINPWPHPNTSDLPDLPNPGQWHTGGFVGAIATGEAILRLPIAKDLDTYINLSFDIGRSLLLDNRI